MSYQIDLQHENLGPLPVSDWQIINWAEKALMGRREQAELTIRLVNKTEIKALNHQYRNKNKATNVLAFPADIPEFIELELPLLGDVIICPEVLEEEAVALGLTIEQHWAHIVIHGVLHLLGYDHIKDDEAEEMQSIEIQLLAEAGFNNPYETEESQHE